MASVFDPWRTAAACVDVMAVTQGGAAAWRSRRAARLAALLAAIGERSPRYRRLLAGRAPADWRLEDLAPAHKADLMRHFDDWVADPALTLAGLRAFTRESANIGRPFIGRYVVWESSGSCGEPALFVQDAAAMAVCDALESARGPVASALPSWLASTWTAFGPTWPRLAFVGAVHGHFASVVSLARLAQVNPWLAGNLRLFSFLQPLAELVAQLNAWPPAVLCTYPSMAWVLAEEQAAGRLRTAPREIWTGGETLTPSLRAALAQRFGVPVRDSYGASECLEIASECRCGRLHLHADWVILEPVDAQLRPVPPGVAGDAALLTNLANHVQPIVRYVLGDRVRELPGGCPCGSTLPAIEVQGRDDEVLSLAGRDGGLVHLAPLALVSVLEDGAGVFDFELRQLDARALALTLHGADAAAGRDAAARHALSSWLRAQGLAGVRLTVRCVAGAGARGASGKCRRVLALPPSAISARRGARRG